ncbi:RUS family member 1 [Spea bombifrons]|uniref:RUS family member 1 n=1 Tax=Spea bombifrons TaxID=233779 RepID=UPI00234ACCEE|nr:RUS family member 1 [Spea bombifrons]
MTRRSPESGSDGPGVICTERYGTGLSKKYLQGKDGSLVCESAPAERHSLRRCLESLLLPHGFPHSVSEDYLEYQLWDTLQAFASSVTGSLATQSLLRGSGVGDATATVAAATVTWILRDGTGMVGRILFAWMKGSRLDCDAKRWRLFADLLNDVAIFMEIVAPAFPSCFTLMVCAAGVCKCIVGVAGGATRAALTVHQARRDNMADVCAKDGSQETLVNLAGLLVALFLVPLVSDSLWATYLLFLLLTSLHLYANYRAVRSIVMETLNQSRLSIVLDYYLREGRILSPAAANRKEPLLPGLGSQAPVQLGVPLRSLLSSVSQMEMLQKGNRSLYLLGWREDTGSLAAVLHERASSADMIRASVHAEILHQKTRSADPARFSVLAETHRQLDLMFPDFQQGLCSAGWVTDRNLLDADDWRVTWDQSKMH